MVAAVWRDPTPTSRQLIALAGTVERSPPDASWLGSNAASLSRRIPQMNLWTVPADALRRERFSFTVKQRGKGRQTLRFIIDKPAEKRKTAAKN